MVLRPDSGDPVEAVLAALRAAEQVFGVDTNAKGYKVMLDAAGQLQRLLNSDASLALTQHHSR